MRIGIIGAGFSGTALAANLAQRANGPVKITLFDKSGIFGAGPAYSTPYHYHLLNVRAQDMSALTDKPMHFVNWLMQYPHEDTYSEPGLSLAEQFVPRKLYGQYLQHLLHEIARLPSMREFEQVKKEVIDVSFEEDAWCLLLADGEKQYVDKVVLALGNNPAAAFPFPVSTDIQTISNPWDYRAIETIPTTDPVLIIGTGLSMIDAVLSLRHHQHVGPIHILSRHGLLPLPHTHFKNHPNLSKEMLASKLSSLTKQLRRLCQEHIGQGGDWREMIHAFRSRLPSLWDEASDQEKLKFLRHVLPYWNIHRHRVHHHIMQQLEQMQVTKQLHLWRGRVISVGDGKACIRPRHNMTVKEIPCRTLINCMGPTLEMRPTQQKLIQSLLEKRFIKLDNLKLGIKVATSGAVLNNQQQVSATMFALGAPTKGTTWEISAVPEIRKQIGSVLEHLLA